jgi:hypothetical protein
MARAKAVSRGGEGGGGAAVLSNAQNHANRECRRRGAILQLCLHFKLASARRLKQEIRTNQPLRGVDILLPSSPCALRASCLLRLNAADPSA